MDNNRLQTASGEVLQGIVVHTTPYNDSSQIATVFVPDQGLIGIFAPLKPEWTVLNEVETVVKRRNGNLWKAQECTVLQGFPELRKRGFTTLQVSLELINAIRASQMEETPAPMLYALLKDYLKRLADAVDPHKILISFFAKIMRHEGVWEDEIPEGVSFEPGEWTAVQALAYCRKNVHFEEVELLNRESIIEKMRQLFVYRIEN